MIRFVVLAAIVALAAAAVFAGLEVAGDDGGSPRSANNGQARSGGGAAGAGSGNTGQSRPAQSDAPAEPQLPESSCPPDIGNCVVASGRVIYVEAVDPDGDGDAHFVTTSDEGVTFPGVTVFDVRKDLRPEPLPGVGDLIGGAGPVFTGSHGQKQIEVIEFHVAR